jgi:predicted amidohydrolase
MEKLAVLQFESGADFTRNLEKLTALFEASGAWLTLAPEVCLSGFCYDRMRRTVSEGRRWRN